MKLAKIKILTSFNAIIALLLAVLGFNTSCDNLGRVEYGTPSARFIVSGKVKSAETNLPAQNIRVIMNRDTVYTNAMGEYEVTDKHAFPQDQTYNIKFRDIRNEPLKQYSDLDTLVVFKDPKFTSGGIGWYAGETKKDLDVKLKPKK